MGQLSLDKSGRGEGKLTPFEQTAGIDLWVCQVAQVSMWDTRADPPLPTCLRSLGGSVGVLTRYGPPSRSFSRGTVASHVHCTEGLLMSVGSGMCGDRDPA